MKVVKNILILCVAVVVLAAFSSCNRRPLDPMNEFVEIRVVVDVDAISNITMDIYNENIPVPQPSTDVMRVLVFDPGTKKLLTESFISSKSISEAGNEVLSGTLNISYGNYDIIVYNFDTPTTKVTGFAEEEALLAYTDELTESQKARYLGRAATKADDELEEKEGITINEEPDHFLVAHENDIRVTPHDEVIVIETEARTIVDSYYIQIHVEGMQYASAATAVISGLSPSNHFGLPQRTDEPSVGVPFDMLKSTDKNLPGENKDVLCAVFNTFGKIPDIESDLYVTFNVVDVAGHLQQYSTNLNTVFLTEDAIEHHWLLIDETWVIDNPTPDEPTDGGFVPKVDDWEEEYGEIVL